jgi:hypothetical protein
MVKNFTREVEEQVGGVPEHGGLLQEIRPKQDEFRVAIRRTAPCFVPGYKSDTSEEPFEESDRVSHAGSDRGGEKWEPHQRFLFLQGEEDYKEIGWDNERETFIDDVLERAEWYAILYMSRLISCPLQHPFDPGRSQENYQTTTLS